MHRSLISASENRIFEIVFSCTCNDRDMFLDGDGRGMDLRGNREVKALSYGYIDMRCDKIDPRLAHRVRQSVPWDEGMWRLGTKRSGTDRALYRIESECLRMCATGPSVRKSMKKEIPAGEKLTVLLLQHYWFSWMASSFIDYVCIYWLLDWLNNWFMMMICLNVSFLKLYGETLQGKNIYFFHLLIIFQIFWLFIKCFFS